MRRHRSLVLVPALLLSAACTRGDDAQSASASPLDRDLTLSAQLQSSTALPSATPDLLASGGACQLEATPKAPTAAQRAQAVALEQRAAEAEFVGNIEVARDLHRQATRLDGTSEQIAYRLARAEEAMGDSAGAVKGYCRYLSLAPMAANAKDARARLSALLPSPTVQVAAQPAATPRVQSMVAVQPTVTTARGNRARARTVTAAPPAPAPVATVASSAGPTPAVAQAPAESSAVSSGSGMATDSAVYSSSAGEVMAQETPAPAETPSEPAPVARRRTDHTVRNAAIGAVAGAAVGAITSRSVKGAAIGGVAGGILGAVVGRATRTSGPSTFRTPGWAH